MSTSEMPPLAVAPGVMELAQKFTALCKAGEFDDANALWSDAVVSIEGLDGDMQVCEGREAVLAKHKAWDEMTDMHGFSAEGPFVNASQFSIVFEMDVTMMGQRQTLREVALYTVRDGAIVEERFFPLAG